MIKQSKRFTSMLVLFVMTIACFCTAFFGMAQARADGYGAGTQIGGAQLRLDEDNPGMRFVLEMSESDYKHYIEIRELTVDEADAGVLVIPSVAVEGGSLTLETENALKIEFNDSYAAKKENGVYCLNAVLKDIPADVYKLGEFAAVGYLMENDEPIYTSMVKRNVEQVAEAYLEYFGENGEEPNEANLAISKDYVLDGYNGATGNEYLTFDAMITALNESATVKLNDANAILFNDADGEQLTANLSQDNYFDNITYKVTGIDKVYTEQPFEVSATGLLTVLNQQGTAIVEASTLGGLVSASSSRITVANETLLALSEAISYSEADGYKQHAKVDDDTTTSNEAFDFIQRNVKLSDAVSSAKAYTNNVFTGADATSLARSNAEYVDGVSGNGTAVKAWKLKDETNHSRNGFLPLNFNTYYNKETIKMFLDAGYDRMILPFYPEWLDYDNDKSKPTNSSYGYAFEDMKKYNASSTIIPSTSISKAHSLDGNKPYFTVYTPNKALSQKYLSDPTTYRDNTRTELGATSDFGVGNTVASNNMYSNISRAYWNQWNNIEIDLQVFYDCFDAFMNGAAFDNNPYYDPALYKGENFAGQQLVVIYGGMAKSFDFAIDLNNNGTSDADDFLNFNYYFGDITLAKAPEVDNSTANRKYIDLSSVDANIIMASQAGSRLAYTNEGADVRPTAFMGSNQAGANNFDFNGLNAGLVSPYHGIINGTTVSKNGGAWHLRPIRADHSEHNYSNNKYAVNTTKYMTTIFGVNTDSSGTSAAELGSKTSTALYITEAMLGLESKEDLQALYDQGYNRFEFYVYAYSRTPKGAANKSPLRYETLGKWDKASNQLSYQGANKNFPGFNGAVGQAIDSSQQARCVVRMDVNDILNNYDNLFSLGKVADPLGNGNANKLSFLTISSATGKHLGVMDFYIYDICFYKV